MKRKNFAIVMVLLLASGTAFSQTLTDVINEFNAAVESLNEQSYESALNQFNNCLTLAEAVGEEADDMKNQAQEQIVGTHYRQAITLMKRKQYDNAIPSLENTVKFAEEYGVKEEFAEKANKYLPPLYIRQGNVYLKQEKFDEALETFDKVLAMNSKTYQAHQGKGLVYKELEEIDNMLEEFNMAKEKAISENDQKLINDVNSAIDGYFRGLIEEELMMIDPEVPDYTFLIDICDEAIEANETNGYAYWQAAMAYNKMVEYDTAIEYAEKGVEVETDPIMLSAIYYELGQAYQNTVRYEDACEAYNKVTEEPFLTKAEKKMMNTPDCN
ncbi:MAG TPA: tetratricopeptide repeat protein [Bacteroidales bacterium]|nr:tetratricopeptide repeat protein [Bacteroidales bacterium]